MNEINLKKCPFCGGEAKIYVTDLGICVKCMNFDCRCQTESIVDLDLDSCKKYNALEYAVKAWNRRSEQKEPDFYICTESFLLANIGDEGELLETQSEILKGSMWSKEKSEYRFCSTSDSVRLENSERWIEISSDSFSKYFTPVWRNK